MKLPLFMFLPLFSSIGLAQADSIFIEKMDGTIRGYPLTAVREISFTGIPTGVHEEYLVQKTLSLFALRQNYPNPFNPATTIRYTIPAAGNVEAVIFDIQGRVIRTLVSAHQPAGDHSLQWDSRNNANKVVASGVYFCRVVFNGSALTRKLLVIR